MLAAFGRHPNLVTQKISIVQAIWKWPENWGMWNLCYEMFNFHSKWIRVKSFGEDFIFGMVVAEVDVLHYYSNGFSNFIYQYAGTGKKGNEI